MSDTQYNNYCVQCRYAQNLGNINTFLHVENSEERFCTALQGSFITVVPQPHSDALHSRK